MLKQQTRTRAARLMRLATEADFSPGLASAMAVAIPRERTMPGPVEPGRPSTPEQQLLLLRRRRVQLQAAWTTGRWWLGVGRLQICRSETPSNRTCRRSVDVFSNCPQPLRKLNRPVVDIRMRQNARKRKSSPDTVNWPLANCLSNDQNLWMSLGEAA